MRAVHLSAVLAALVLGANLAAVGRAPAQGLVEAAPPADGSSRVGQPRIEGVKFETDAALPPKAGSAFSINRGMIDVLTPRLKARKGPAGNVSSR